MDEELNEFGMPDSDGLEAENDADDYGYADEAEDAPLASGDAEEAQNAEADTQGEVDDYTPPAVNVPLMPMGDDDLFTEEESAQLDEMYLNGQGAQASAWIARRMREAAVKDFQRMMQAQVAQANTFNAAEGEFPELFKVHGSTIRQTAATVAPEHVGTPAAQFTALIAPFIMEVQAGADPIKTAKRMGQLLSRQTRERETPAVQPMSAPRVAPTGRGGTPAPQRRSSVVNDMMELFGADEADVKRAMNVAKGRL